jgi:predicted nuclease of predicted toxin-antitoxin system
MRCLWWLNEVLVDAQLPPALAQWLREAGHEAQHVEDFSLRESADRVIWNHALQQSAIIITKDEDFAERSNRESASPLIVWLRIGNTTNARLREWIEPRLAGIVLLAGQGNRVIEVI